MSLGTLPNALVVIAVVVVVLARRLSWSELENSDADVWRGPLVLMGVGVYQLYDRHTVLGAVDVVLLVVGAVLALVAGVGSGRVAQVQRRAGKVFFRLGMPGLGIMVAYLVVRLGLAGLGHLLGASVAGGGGGALMVSMGANLLTQSLIIQSKASQMAEEYTNQ
ncbi:hypothetical protein [Kribbella sindirgiensis]|uniref:DUF1453 domain-containing protein n=1 Tax=Kribbella sindirgiensis TaxID=1124744 RepID=A0A4R0IMC1_9ACTN|nr:hypothetical protein [Kribbella sindirgiensis]TCC32466.1 hypothetical protein E0H50_20010 [Kribbella sindirgiensis]